MSKDNVLIDTIEDLKEPLDKLNMLAELLSLSNADSLELSPRSLRTLGYEILDQVKIIQQCRDDLNGILGLIN